MILGAFAQGDAAALRPLLNDEVYANFAREIERRQKAGERLDNQIVRMREADIVEARLDGRTALVTVKFITDQVNLLRDRSGEPLPGQSTEPAEVVDLWTFARDTRSRDPNWLLVATGTAH
jgi:predicted lipid-binding transport protein (Tim44 family)